MRIELICVGSELLSDKLNTHTNFVGDQLNSVGLQLNASTTVSDNFEDMVEIFTRVLKGADIVLVTGGLGPTFDDLTREAVSKVLDKKLILDNKLLEQILKFFAGRNVEMPGDNRKQAYLLEGAQPLENKNGTAPGQLLKVNSNKFNVRTLFLLPGPKKELTAILNESVLPLLKQEYKTKIIKSRLIHVYGMSESKVNELIKPVIEAERKFEGNSVSFTILAHMSIIDLKVTVSGSDELLIDEIIHNITNEFYEILGENIYGQDMQALEGVIADLFIKNRKTLSIAESCTGGLLSDKITDVPGSSAFFKEGVVAYSDSSKTALLKVPAELIEKHGAVSEETALSMARGMKELSGSDYSIAITGIAGPAGGTQEKPVGTVCFAIAAQDIPAHSSHSSNDKSFKQHFIGKRKEIKERSVLFALNILRKELLHSSRNVKKVH